MMPQKIWVLYNEEGAYSDYSMNIEGVFSSAEIAMATYDATHCAMDLAYSKAARSFPDWKQRKDGTWHKTNRHGNNYNGQEVTVKEFPVDWIHVWDDKLRDFRMIPVTIPKSEG